MNIESLIHVKRSKYPSIIRPLFIILTKLSVVLLIILIILPFITDALYHYFQRPKNSYHPDIINTIKFRTGDIISYTWRDYSLFDTNKIHKYKFNVINHLNEILPNLFNGKTTHVAIIICLNNVPYIYELNDDDAYIFITKILIYQYHGIVIFIKK